MPDGSMLIVAMSSRRVLRRSLDGKIRVHADLGGIAASHCNDMVVDSNGRAYVGEFGFDLHKGLETRGPSSVFADHVTAKLARISPEGVVDVAAQDLHFPNGTVITPDGRTLIVAETLAAGLTAFDIGRDGTLSGRRVWRRPCLAVPTEKHSTPPVPYGLPTLLLPNVRASHREGCAGNGRDGPELQCVHVGRRRRQNAFHDDRAVFSPKRGGRG